MERGRRLNSDRKAQHDQVSDAIARCTPNANEAYEGVQDRQQSALHCALSRMQLMFRSVNDDSLGLLGCEECFLGFG